MFQKAVGQGTFTMVDMSYYAKIPNIFHPSHSKECAKVRLKWGN
jgi:hypothetical protein